MVCTNQCSYSVSKYRILKDYLDFYQMRHNKLPSLFLINYLHCFIVSIALKLNSTYLLIWKHKSPSRYFGLNKKKYSCYQLKYKFSKNTLSTTKKQQNHQIVSKTGKKNVPIQRLSKRINQHTSQVMLSVSFSSNFM